MPQDKVIRNIFFYLWKSDHAHYRQVSNILAKYLQDSSAVQISAIASNLYTQYVEAQF